MVDGPRERNTLGAASASVVQRLLVQQAQRGPPPLDERRPMSTGMGQVPRQRDLG